MQLKAPYISSITPLRGLAALLVAIFHFQSAIARFIPSSITQFIDKSYLMVDLFFILSGFIIYHVYGTRFQDQMNRSDLRTYLVARVARIYPLHLFSLLLLVILVWGFLPPATQPKAIETPFAILTNALLLHSFGVHSIYTWNIPSWSISAEVFSYLFFPALSLWLWKQRKGAVLGMILLCLFAYLSIMYLLPRRNPLYPEIPVPHNLNTTYDYGFSRGLAGFIIGMLLYRLYRQDKARKWLSSDWVGWVSILLVILSLHFALNDLVIVIVFALLVVAMACNGGRLKAACDGRVLQFLGDISYSIYLMQIFLQVPFAHGMRLPGTSGFGRGRQTIAFLSGSGYCLLYLLLLVGISAISYYVVEVPCRKWINRRWGSHKVLSTRMASGAA